MLPSATLHTLLPALLLAGSAAGAGFDCKNAIDNKVKWDFGELKGKHSVSWAHTHKSGANIWNTTFTLDICEPMKKTDEVPCTSGSHVCAIDQMVNKDGETEGKPEYTDIAGDYGLHGGHTDHTWTRLKDSASSSDSEREGVRLKLDGGKDEETKQKQRALIEFICIDKKKRSSTSTLGRREDDEDGDDDDDDDGDHHSGGSHDDIPEDWKKLQETDDGKGGTIKYLSYKVEKEFKVLRLEWKTKYACEGAADDEDLHDGDTESSGGWGFFSWFFFLAFMGILAYFAFFAWINYSRHGATGWDMLPHADTIRDIPYILGDWGRKLVGTVQGGSSRGGYSAL